MCKMKSFFFFSTDVTGPAPLSSLSHDCFFFFLFIWQVCTTAGAGVRGFLSFFNWFKLLRNSILLLLPSIEVRTELRSARRAQQTRHWPYCSIQLTRRRHPFFLLIIFRPIFMSDITNKVLAINYRRRQCANFRKNDHLASSTRRVRRRFINKQAAAACAATSLSIYNNTHEREKYFDFFKFQHFRFVLLLLDAAAVGPWRIGGCSAPQAHRQLSDDQVQSRMNDFAVLGARYNRNHIRQRRFIDGKRWPIPPSSSRTRHVIIFLFISRRFYNKWSPSFYYRSFVRYSAVRVWTMLLLSAALTFKYPIWESVCSNNHWIIHTMAHGTVPLWETNDSNGYFLIFSWKKGGKRVIFFTLKIDALGRRVIPF